MIRSSNSCWHAKNPLSSPFLSKFWIYLVLLWAAFCWSSFIYFHFIMAKTKSSKADVTLALGLP